MKTSDQLLRDAADKLFTLPSIYQTAFMEDIEAQMMLPTEAPDEFIKILRSGSALDLLAFLLDSTSNGAAEVIVYTTNNYEWEYKEDEHHDDNDDGEYGDGLGN